MLRTILMVVASVMLLIGAASMVTPIPGGTLLIAASLALLICTSPRFTRAVAAARSRMAILNGAMTWLENRIGQRLGDALQRTRPPLD